LDGHIVRYHWESNIDSELSNRSSFNSSELSIGKHTISFTVLDDLGTWSNPVNEELLITTKYKFNGTYTFHEPIIIEGDNNFTRENGVVGGLGTENDPYIIERIEDN